jgi:hypothetical protein
VAFVADRLAERGRADDIAEEAGDDLAVDPAMIARSGRGRYSDSASTSQPYVLAPMPTSEVADRSRRQPACVNAEVWADEQAQQLCKPEVAGSSPARSIRRN